MKNYKIESILLAVIVCLGLSSCQDFLQIEPKTFVSEDNFWNEKVDIDQSVIGIYTKMQSDEFIRRCIVWGEIRSDNIEDGMNCERDQQEVYRTLQEQLLPTNPFTNWQSFYSVINTCNIVYERAPEVSEKDPVYTQSMVLATQAEVTFIRALCYYYLVRTFKDVPYYTDAIQVDEEAKPIAPTNGDEIVRYLIADLESVVKNALKAYPKDNSAKYNSNCNRATQNAIYSLLADLCLWDGQYQKCIDYAQKVIDAKYQEFQDEYANHSGGSSTTVYVVNGNVAMTTSDNVTLFKWVNDPGKGYPLIPCFSSLSSNSFGADFNSIFGSYGNSFESIFELAFTTNGNDNYIANSACGALYGNHYAKDGNAGKGFLAASDEVIGDLPNKIYKVFENGYDARFYSNLYTEKKDDYASAYVAKFVNYGITIQSGSTNTNLQFTATPTLTTNNYVDRNWIFYRLTDVMLLQAEALIEKAASETYELRDEEGNVVRDDDGVVKIDEDLRRAFGLIYAVNRRSILAPTTGTNSVVNTNELKINSFNTKTTMRALCKAERRRELMFEGKRWFDIVRYTHREGNLSNVPSKRLATKIVNEEALYWPYNRTELKNNTELHQKPFYDTSKTDDEDTESTTE